MKSEQISYIFFKKSYLHSCHEGVLYERVFLKYQTINTFNLKDLVSFEYEITAVS